MGESSRTDRLRTVLAGQTPDRPTVSFWRHFFREETSAAGLARATLDFQHAFDWDFVKVNARAGYHAEAWGSRYTFHDDDHTSPTLDAPAVTSPDDWARLPVLDPDHGALGEHLEALRLIRDGLDADVPFMMTVFTPLSIAARLTGSDDVLRQHIDTAPDAVEAGLRTITETFSRFAVACLDAGCCGLYYATTTWGTTDRMTWDEFERFSRPYDLQVLGALGDRAWFTILHVCGADAFADRVLDYPVQALSWDVTDPTTPNLSDVAGCVKKALVGGITQDLTPDDANRDALLAEADAARDATRGRPWILGAGCCLPTHVTDANLRALRQWVDRP